MAAKKAKKKTKKSTAKITCEIPSNCSCSTVKCGSGGCAYFLGFLGSAIYYIMNATGFWNGVWGVIKALVWPAFLVFSLMKNLGM